MVLAFNAALNSRQQLETIKMKAMPMVLARRYADL